MALCALSYSALSLTMQSRLCYLSLIVFCPEFTIVDQYSDGVQDLQDPQHHRALHCGAPLRTRHHHRHTHTPLHIVII